MLEGLINNKGEGKCAFLIADSLKLYHTAVKELDSLSKLKESYKTTYGLSTVDVYVNMALVHGQMYV